MHYRRVGMWGLKLSEVGFGSWLIFNQGDQALADTLHRTAYEQGINFFDTSTAYGRGQTEVMVGRALKPFRRDSMVLATKVFWPFDPSWPFPDANDRGLSRSTDIAQQASLVRGGLFLAGGETDVLALHRNDAVLGRAELVEQRRLFAADAFAGAVQLLIGRAEAAGGSSATCC